MKTIFITFFSFLFLSGCAYMDGIKDQQIAAKPIPKNATTVTTPNRPAPDVAASEENKAATTAGKLIAPVVH